MTPTRIDVSIICQQCQKPVEKREMIHDAPGGVYRYYVSCHGAKDFGDHLAVTTADAHGKVLSAFPEANLGAAIRAAGEPPLITVPTSPQNRV
jgi:hypothetical protein